MFVKQIENGLDLADIAKSVAAVYDTLLPPGQRIQTHLHPDIEEIYYVLSGYGIMTIGDEEKEISRGDVVFIPQHAVHTLLNTAEVPLRFVTVSVKSGSSRKDDVQPYIG